MRICGMRIWRVRFCEERIILREAAAIQRRLLAESFDERERRWLAEVEQAIDSGFKSKAQKKRAASLLGSIWDGIYDKIFDANNERIWNDFHTRGLSLDFDESGNLSPETLEWQDTFEVPERERTKLPHYLTHVRDNHLHSIKTEFPEHYEDVLYIKNLLETVKAANITPLPPKQDPVEVKVEARVKSIFDEMARRKKQFTDAVEFGKLFGGLRVSATPHYSYSKYGNEYIRVFYYLNGKLTPVSVIVAAAEALEKQGKEVPILE